MRGLLGGNWGLKLVSLAFAVLLWFFVVGEEKAEVTLSIPLEIVNVPPRMVIANDPPPYIEVRAYGPRNLLRNLTLQGLSKVIDLRGAKAGEMIIHLSPESLALPSGVRTRRIQPATIQIVLDWLLEKTVEIEPVIVGTVAPYYEIAGWEVNPKKVLVSGPAREIKALDKVRTLPIDLKGATKDVLADTALDVEGLHISLPERVGLVQVAVHIRPIQGEKRITHVPVQFDKKAVERVWPPVVTCMLKGPLVELKRLHPKDISVSVDLSGVPADASGLKRLPLRIVPPPGMTVVKVVPESVKAKVKKRPRLENTGGNEGTADNTAAEDSQ